MESGAFSLPWNSLPLLYPQMGIDCVNNIIDIVYLAAHDAVKAMKPMVKATENGTGVVYLAAGKYCLDLPERIQIPALLKAGNIPCRILAHVLPSRKPSGLGHARIGIPVYRTLGIAPFEMGCVAHVAEGMDHVSHVLYCWEGHYGKEGATHDGNAQIADFFRNIHKAHFRKLVLEGNDFEAGLPDHKIDTRIGAVEHMTAGKKLNVSALCFCFDDEPASLFRIRIDPLRLDILQYGDREGREPCDKHVAQLVRVKGKFPDSKDCFDVAGIEQGDNARRSRIDLGSNTLAKAPELVGRDLAERMSYAIVLFKVRIDAVWKFGYKSRERDPRAQRCQDTSGIVVAIVYSCLIVVGSASEKVRGSLKQSYMPPLLGQGKGQIEPVLTTAKHYSRVGVVHSR